MIPLLALAYLLSGLCALIYETVWIYQFSRIFGSTVLAMSSVVAVFFAGLAAGSRIFGKASSKASHPLRLYAFLELAIGAYALAFPLIIGGAERIYAACHPACASNFALLTLVRLLLSFLVILPPTLLMGGSLPVLLTCFTDRMATLGWRAGVVYGLNTLGAALGSFLAGYALLEAWGVAWTNAAAGLLNLAIGLFAWVLSRRWNPRAADAVPAERAGDAARVPDKIRAGRVRLVIGCFALAGFVSMSCEVLWLRYLTFYFQETIRLYAGILTVFILGIGLGSLAGGFAAERISRRTGFLGLLQAFIGVLTFLAVYVPVYFFQSIVDAGARSASNVLAILCALLLPPALLMGAVFPVVTRIIVGHLGEVGHRVGGAYALNTLGGILGLLCTGFLFQGLLGLQLTLYLVLGTSTLLATVLLWAEGGSYRRLLVGLPAIFFIGGIVVVGRAGLSLPQSVMRRPLVRTERVVEVKEGPVGIAWATRDAANQIVQLWENGVRISANGRSTCQVQGYIPMLVKAELPREVLGLAFGGGLSYRGPRQFPEVRRFDFVDISRENMDVALRVFPENAGLREDPRARFIVNDAYSQLKYVEATYDLILVEPTPPRYGYQTAALYTQEFYQFARRRLNEDGLFAQVLSLGDLSPAETAGVMRTFSSVFPQCLLWKNVGDCVMLGSEKELRLNVRAIAERLNRPEVQATLRASAPSGEKYYLLDRFLSGLLLTDQDFRRAAARGDIYTDDRSALRYTTGRDVTTGNVRLIHANLSPWTEIGKLFDEYPEFEQEALRLNMNREYFMLALYRKRPEEFRQVFREYVELLRSYLSERGTPLQADEVDWLTHGDQ